MKKLFAMSVVALTVLGGISSAQAAIVNVSNSATGPTAEAARAELTRKLTEESCQGRGGTPAGAVTITFEGGGPVVFTAEGTLPCDIP